MLKLHVTISNFLRTIARVISKLASFFKLLMGLWNNSGRVNKDATEENTERDEIDLGLVKLGMKFYLAEIAGDPISLCHPKIQCCGPQGQVITITRQFKNQLAMVGTVFIKCFRKWLIFPVYSDYLASRERPSRPVERTRICYSIDYTIEYIRLI